MDQANGLIRPFGGQACVDAGRRVAASLAHSAEFLYFENRQLAELLSPAFNYAASECAYAIRPGREERPVDQKTGLAASLTTVLNGYSGVDFCSGQVLELGRGAAAGFRTDHRLGGLLRCHHRSVRIHI